ncbi:hypothetical protein CB1_015160011 [Camelus ferus]|nr:hypothetical protein CB1_015160011 [Camelus ferus]
MTGPVMQDPDVRCVAGAAPKSGVWAHDTEWRLALSITLAAVISSWRGRGLTGFYQGSDSSSSAKTWTGGACRVLSHCSVQVPLGTSALAALCCFWSLLGLQKPGVRDTTFTKETLGTGLIQVALIGGSDLMQTEEEDRHAVTSHCPWREEAGEPVPVRQLMVEPMSIPGASHGGDQKSREKAGSEMAGGDRQGSAGEDRGHIQTLQTGDSGFTTIIIVITQQLRVHRTYLVWTEQGNKLSVAGGIASDLPSWTPCLVVTTWKSVQCA